MDGGALAVLAAFAGGWDGIARVLILGALGLGVVSAVRMLACAEDCAVPAAERRETGLAYPVLRWQALVALYGPIAGVALGFWFGGRTQNYPWVVPVTAAAALVMRGTLRWARRAAQERGDRTVAGAVVAAVLCGGLLLQFGLLMVVRLEVVKDPELELAQTASAWADGLGPVVLPALVLAAVATVGVPARSFRTEWTGRWHGVAAAVVTALFTLSVFGPKRLTFVKVPWQEYGKVVYLAALAVLLSGLAFALGRGRELRGSVRDGKYLWFPVVLFAGVAFGSGLRSDLGPVLVLFTVTTVVLAYVIGEQSGRSIAVRGRSGIGRGAAGARTFLDASWRYFAVFAAVLVVVAAVVWWQMPYVRNRVEAMVEPWTYNWVAACRVAEVTVEGVPPGTVACRSSLDAIAAEERSQLARGLAVIADGGLWGRGLGDTGSRGLQLGSSDFVVAVVWGKLGGIVVVLLGVLLGLLACAVVRSARLSAAVDEQGRRSVRLFALGVAALVAVQGLYSFLSTLGLLPHTGITVPFLSRGGHATIALGLALMAAVWVAYRPGVPERGRPLTPRRSLPAVPLGAAALFIVPGLVLAVVAPYRGYAVDRPYCLDTAPKVDPEVCSTDGMARRRSTVELSIGGTTRFRSSATGWESLDGNDLSGRDLAGLLRIGGHAGAVDHGLRQFIQGSTGLSEPWLPPVATRPGLVELTVDPRVQRAATDALTGGDAPLAGGVVVMDARTGHVLAASSAPVLVPTDGGHPGPVPEDVREGFADLHRRGVITGPGIDESRADECGEIDWDERCGIWRLQPAPAPETPESLADRARYSDGDPRLAPPATDNRALGRNYGLGSTFKVIVAAAYLRTPGTSVNDPVPAPLSYDSGPRVLFNYNGGACPGTAADGTITIAQALAVSCNTAFLELADELGWDAVRDTAADFGFTVGPVGGKRGTAWLAETATGIDSRVPAEADRAQQANNVLGGGEVEGTPLHMAAVMAALANDGVLVQPTLVAALTPPIAGPRRPVEPDTRRVMTPDQARDLLGGLAGTARPGGTAAALEHWSDRNPRVKTGTHDLYGGDPPPSGKFAAQIAWLVGVVDTAAGPVAFAVAVETRDEGAGGARARAVADQVLTAVTEVRG